MATPEPHYGYRPHPQVSASQMAEYILASATRRKSIIREARFPKTSIVAQYQKARECLTDFLDDGTRSLNHMARALDHLSKRTARPDATEWIKRDSRFSTEAIEVFQRSYNKLGLPKLACQAVRGRQPALEIGPTKISVGLDLTTRKPTNNGRDHVGGVILVFSRGEASDRKRIERCKTVAGLVYLYCTKFLTTMGDVDRALCLAIDVFDSRSYTPPGTFAQRLRLIKDSCDEIATRWKTVSPPADYDGPDPD